MAVKRTRIPAHPTNYYVGRREPIKYIVIHTGETGEGSTPAEGMGNWFASDHGPGRRSSAHQGADTDSICTYVADGNTAFGAPGVNASGWHLEHAGRAGQTKGQWDDAGSRLILANGALAAAEASKRLGIPARWLTDAELRGGRVKGFITHAQASRVLGGTHWDPGPNFPADRYMALVRSHLSGNQEDDVTPEQMNDVAELVVKKLLGADVIKAPTPSKTNPYWGVNAALEWTLRRSAQTYALVAAMAKAQGIDEKELAASIANELRDPLVQAITEQAGAGSPEQVADAVVAKLAAQLSGVPSGE